MAVAAGALTMAADPLAPIRSALLAMATRPGRPSLTGLAPHLTVDRGDLGREDGWRTAVSLVSGEALADLLDTAKRRWRAAPHAAAALAWKCYSYWLALPAVLGYAAARRVPLLRPASVVVKWSARQPFLVVGLTSVEVAVLPSDPLARGARVAGVRVVPDERALLAEMRVSLVEEHLAPVLENIKRGSQVGRRTLWGSLASGVAHGLSRAADDIPGSSLETASTILAGLGVADLVELTPREGGQAGLNVQRKTCCLAFTLPKPKICEGCCVPRR